MRKLPPIKKDDPFKFLKEGHDTQFEQAMNSIGAMYDDIFKDDNHLNSIFQGLKVQNNPTLQPISNMFNEVFDPQSVKDKREYQKVTPAQKKQLEREQQDDEEESLVMGEPVYIPRNTDWNKKL